MDLIWHKKPDEAVAKKCRELEEIKRQSGTKVYWELLRRILKTDPWFLMRVVLQWSWLDEDLVGVNFIRHVAENWGSDLSILFPRGHGKTLPMSAIVVSAILNDPNTAILEISRTEDNANKFGATVADHLLGNEYLQRCFGTKYSPDGFLPASISECKLWGKDGYVLPRRKPRFDPTLLCISIKSAKAGKHPDWIYIDDPTEEENNNPAGWETVTKVIDGCKLLLSADGFFIWTGTRWHDADPLGKAEHGKLKGKQGRFKTVKYSCYVDDNPKKPPIYARKKRWNMDKPTGYTHEMLEDMRAPKEEGGLGEFFDAQMRNDPIPQERADIKISDVVIYEPEDLPKLSDVQAMGIETTGGGMVIYNGFIEWLDELKIKLPLVNIENPRKDAKFDRILAALQPITASGRLYAQKWMLGDGSEREGLGYEIRRLGYAAHDDIVDALHNVPANLSKNLVPLKPDLPADLYISVDLAWSEKKRADWTVAVAVAVDHKNNYWVIDYDRFQLSSPTGIYTRLLQFYNKYKSHVSIRNMASRKHPGAWR